MEITITQSKANKLPIINSLFIKFSEYTPELFDKLMRIDGAIYDKKTQTIEIGCEWYEDVCRICNKYGTIKFDNKVCTNSTSNVSIPKNYKFKIKPYKHQIEGIEFGLNHDRWLLLDD